MKIDIKQFLNMESDNEKCKTIFFDDNNFLACDSQVGIIAKREYFYNYKNIPLNRKDFNRIKKTIFHTVEKIKTVDTIDNFLLKNDYINFTDDKIKLLKDIFNNQILKIEYVNQEKRQAVIFSNYTFKIAIMSTLDI